MSNPLPALALVALLALAGCAGSAAVATAPAMRPATDWIALDRGLPRGLPQRGDHWRDDESNAPMVTRLGALGFEAAHDSLGLNELASRPLAEQHTRRREAARLLGEAMRIIEDGVGRLQADVARAALDSVVRDGQNTVIEQVLARLHTAVGTDPEHADAWAALAFFSAVIGDDEAAMRARHAYLERAITADASGRTRTARVVLDEAWALRDAGLHERCQHWLDAHRGLLDAAPPAHEALPPRLERDLIAGLLAAEGGDRLGTRRRINRLPLVPIRQGSRDRDSDYLRTWVRAWLELSTGNPDDASHVVGQAESSGRHTAVDWRYWEDVGRIAEASGQHDAARQAWQRALLARPYPGFFPWSVHRGPADVLGYPDTDAPHAVSYQTHRVGGSAWGFAFTMAWQCLEGPRTGEPRLRREAVAALDRCIRRDDRPGAARLLRARLHLQHGNAAAAAAVLRDPTVNRLAAGALADEVATLRGAARRAAAGQQP